jgi:uncharacterized protein YkwD
MARLTYILIIGAYFLVQPSFSDGIYLNDIPISQSQKGESAPKWQPVKATASAEAQKILALTNQLRKAHHLAPVVLDASMNRRAQKWANYMNTSGYYGHPVNREQYWEGVETNGHVGQNITVRATAEEAMASWVGSSGHLQNLLNPDFTHTGIGQSGEYWCQDFAE